MASMIASADGSNNGATSDLGGNEIHMYIHSKRRTAGALPHQLQLPGLDVEIRVLVPDGAESDKRGVILVGEP